MKTKVILVGPLFGLEGHLAEINAVQMNLEENVVINFGDED